MKVKLCDAFLYTTQISFIFLPGHIWYIHLFAKTSFHVFLIIEIKQERLKFSLMLSESICKNHAVSNL